MPPGDVGHRIAEKRHAGCERYAFESELLVFLDEQSADEAANDIPHLLRIRVLGLAARLVTRWFDAFERVRYFGRQWRFGKIAFRKIGAVALLIAHGLAEPGGFDTGQFVGRERREPLGVVPAVVGIALVLPGPVVIGFVAHGPSLPDGVAADTLCACANFK